MITPVHARTMAAYNRWMNERLYELCAGIPDAERKRDRGAFFKSVHGTLNHLLYGDRAWMSRFTGRDLGWKGPADELYADFAELRAARRARPPDRGLGGRRITAGSSRRCCRSSASTPG